MYEKLMSVRDNLTGVYGTTANMACYINEPELPHTQSHITNVSQ